MRGGDRGLVPLLHNGILIAVVKEDLIAWANWIYALKAGRLPPGRNDQESVRLVTVIDISCVIGFGAFADDDVIRADPHDVIRSGTLAFIEQLGLRDDLASIIPDRLLQIDRYP